MERQAMQDLDRPFNLRLYLGVTTGVAVTVLGVVLAVLFSGIITRSILEVSEQNALAMVGGMLDRLADMGSDPSASMGDGASLQSGDGLRFFQNWMDEFDIEYIRVYDAEGCVLFGFPQEEVEGQVGECVQNDVSLDEALAGEPVSRVYNSPQSTSGEESAGPGSHFPVDAIVAYVPVQNPVFVEGIGTPQVFEVYMGIAPLHEALRESYQAIGGVVAGTMVVFFGVQFVFARRAERIIRSQREELERRNRTLEELQAVKDDLTHMIVHDMKNPLGGIMGYLGIVIDHWERGKLTETYVQYLKRAYDGCRQLLDMTVNLLDIGRIEEGKMMLKREPVDLAEALEEVTQTLLPGVLRGEKQLEVQVPAEFPPLDADRDVTRRVLTNLISNGIKHTDAGGHITVDVGREDGFARISVLDDGEGIPDEAIPHLFDKFSQVGDKRLGDETDTGLGLTFCKLAVEAHGGRIWVESQVGEGSAFSFTMPLAALGSPRIDHTI